LQCVTVSCNVMGLVQPKYNNGLHLSSNMLSRV